LLQQDLRFRIVQDKRQEAAPNHYSAPFLSFSFNKKKAGNGFLRAGFRSASF
jgi:hypothetical protein